MDATLDVTLLEPHYSELQALAAASGAIETSGYLLFGSSHIVADPWTGEPRLRLVSHRYVSIADEDRIDASEMHVTWSTRGFMRLLGEAVGDQLVPGIVHTHPGSHAFFSDQDDRNEAELARTAGNRGALGLVSVVLGGDGSVCARLWKPDGTIAEATAVQVVGGHYLRWHSGEHEASPDHLDRQKRLFGEGFNPLARSLRVGVIGGGGTGSPSSMLLARLGIQRLLLLDKDRVELPNLNRLHGARRSDAEDRKFKVEVLKREIEVMDLGIQVVALETWASDLAVRDALKSCDFILGCTDDHSGRIFINRLAYFYGIPVIDVGLRMMLSAHGVHDINGRVTTLVPGRPCLLCGGVVDPKRAAEEALERIDPDEFRRRKAEAYVVGRGDPAPSVVTFTTEMACVAVNEMIAALTGFHGDEGMVPTRIRRFHARDDRFLAVESKEYCSVCKSQRYWGRADLEPFLDLIGEA